jgi:hypothetical protein
MANWNLNEAPTDICLAGEDEETLTEVVEAIYLGRQKLKNILEITFGNNGKIISNPKRPLIKNLNSIPFTVYNLSVEKLIFVNIKESYVT